MPNWVMVPVPVEYELSVLERVLVLGMTASGGVTWSPELLARHFEALAPDARTLARTIARGVVSNQPMEDTELAARLGMSTREVLGLAQEVNDVTIDPFPGVIISVQSEQAEGAGAARRRLLRMNALVAAAICDLVDDPRTADDT
jgi:hypothetical protein